jgi:deoxyribose-phosphate aldolase
MIAATIDHTLLAAAATEDDIRRLCAEAGEWGFATVCVNPLHVALAAQRVRGTATQVCTVIGFPLGATTTATKITEALGALDDGAHEVDMVGTLGLLKGGAAGRYRDDIAAVVEVARRRNANVIIKVILETGALTREEKLIAARAAAEAGADFVKTSTGMGAGGATSDDVRLLRATVPPHVRVKASGGIRTLAQARALLEAGAARLGTSAGVTIARDAGERPHP